MLLLLFLLMLLLLLLIINYLLITCINTLYSSSCQFIYLVLYLHHTNQQPLIQAHSTLLIYFIHIFISISIKPIHIITLFNNLITLFWITLFSYQPPIPPTLVHSAIILPTIYTYKVDYLPWYIQQLHMLGQYRQ